MNTISLHEKNHTTIPHWLSFFFIILYFKENNFQRTQCLRDSSRVIKVTFYEITIVVSLCPMTISILIVKVLHLMWWNTCIPDFLFCHEIRKTLDYWNYQYNELLQYKNTDLQKTSQSVVLHLGVPNFTECWSVSTDHTSLYINLEGWLM